MDRLAVLLSYFGGWTENDGPSRGIFANQIPGHKCAWSCRWEGAHERFSPDSLCLLETMDTPELLAELMDLAYRAGKGILRGDFSDVGFGSISYLLAAVIDAFSVEKEADWQLKARTCLAQQRARYPTYALPDIYEAKVMGGVTFRPGWKHGERPAKPEKVEVVK